MSDPHPTVPAKPPSVWHNWVTLAGAIVAGGALFSFLLLFAINMFGGAEKNPYLGILSYLVAPAFLVAGLVLVLGGAWHQYRNRNLRPGLPPPHLVRARRHGLRLG